MQTGLEFLKELQLELLQEDDDRLWMVSQYEYLPTTEKYATDLYYYDTYTNQMYPTLEKLIASLKDTYGDIPDLDDDVMFDWAFIEKFTEIPDEIRDTLREIPVIKTHVIKYENVFLTVKACQTHILENHYEYDSTAHPYGVVINKASQYGKLMDIIKETDWENSHANKTK